jgi:uncharacterized protein YerC
MTHVSRFPIHKDVYFEILNELYWVLADVKKPDEMKQFLGDFFTKTEHIILAKRLALAGMILHEYDQDIIKKVLHVSTATIYRMKEKLEYGGEGFKTGIRRITRKELFDTFIQKLFEKPQRSMVHPLSNS